jgi:methyl coenzyme M reductase beta subunit|tara:strand:+ start:97 stop:342 length:246 start_codon:yes stop_codon:yes gene_type:complete
MTDEQIKQLAGLIAEEVIKQLEIKEMDNILIEHMNDPYELLIAELARLMTLMATYEESEQYEKAAVIKNKIDRLQKQIEKL